MYVPCTMDSSFFSPQMATWRPNFSHQRLWAKAKAKHTPTKSWQKKGCKEECMIWNSFCCWIQIRGHIFIFPFLKSHLISLNPFSDEKNLQFFLLKIISFEMFKYATRAYTIAWIWQFFWTGNTTLFQILILLYSKNLFWSNRTHF